jgi:hypothetical protein
VADGLTTADIARRLRLSEKSVRNRTHLTIVHVRVAAPSKLLNRGAGKILSWVCEVEPAPGSDPAADSPQLWQHHRMPDRIAHERPFGLLFNRPTGRALTVVPAADSQLTLVVTVLPLDPGGPTAGLQLWTALPA